MYWVVNDKHIILFGFGSRIFSGFKVVERDSKPFLSSKEGEKAGVNMFKFEVEYHTNSIQTKFVFVCMTILRGCSVFLCIYSKSKVKITPTAKAKWFFSRVIKPEDVGDKIYSTLGVVQLF